MLLEEPLLHEIHERAGAEDAHELVERPQHRRRDRPAPERMHREAPEPARTRCPGESPSERGEALRERPRVLEQRLVVAGVQGRRLLRRRLAGREHRQRVAGDVGRQRPWLRRHSRRRERLRHARDSAPARRDRGQTGMPSAASRPARSSRIPRASASSFMFSRARSDLELRELHREQERAAQVLGVADLPTDRHTRRLARSARAPADALVLAERQERVEARRIDQLAAVPRGGRA